MRVLAILQARVNSSRLPGKVLKPIVGKPMLALQLERLQRVEQFDGLIVATSDLTSDDGIAELCQKLDIPCFRGPLDDVLDRYYQAAVRYEPEHIVRVTGDCPLTDAKVIDKVISAHLSSNVDYSANCQEPSYPDGLDVEVFKFSALQEAWQQAEKPSEREHVTPYIRNHPEKFRCQQISSEQNLSHLRWTVDEPEDFELVEQIYQELYPTKPDFATADILQLIKQRPELSTLNSHFIRNEGLLKSQAQDKELGYDQ